MSYLPVGGTSQQRPQVRTCSGIVGKIGANARKALGTADYHQNEPVSGWYSIIAHDRQRGQTTRHQRRHVSLSDVGRRGSKDSEFEYFVRTSSFHRRTAEEDRSGHFEL